MSKISQRDAQQLRKRVRELEVEEDRRRNSWSDGWPGGVEITRLTVPSETVMGVRVARKLKHAVVATIASDGALILHALPLARKSQDHG